MERLVDMFAGFLPLVFNPYAWIAVALTALVAFSGGFVNGWGASNADQWHKVAVAAQEAAKDKERLAEDDRKRAEAAELNMAKLDAALEGLMKDANLKATACRLSQSDLDELRVLATAGGGVRR
jgi:hypothetical protein